MIDEFMEKIVRESGLSCLTVTLAPNAQTEDRFTVFAHSGGICGLGEGQTVADALEMAINDLAREQS